MQPTSFESTHLKNEIKEIKLIWHVSVGHFSSLVHTHILLTWERTILFFSQFCIEFTYVFFISYSYLFHKLYCICLLMIIHITVNMNMWLLYSVQSPSPQLYYHNYNYYYSIAIILITSIWDCEGLCLNPGNISLCSLDQGLCTMFPET